MSICLYIDIPYEILSLICSNDAWLPLLILFTVSVKTFTLGEQLGFWKLSEQQLESGDMKSHFDFTYIYCQEKPVIQKWMCRSSRKLIRASPELHITGLPSKRRWQETCAGIPRAASAQPVWPQKVIHNDHSSIKPNTFSCCWHDCTEASLATCL